MREELYNKLRVMNLMKIYKIREELSRLHKWESALTVRYTHHGRIRFWNNRKGD